MRIFIVVKAFGKILMFSSLCILMLHTVMPHQHHGEVSNEIHNFEHDSADSILDFIQLAFHFNPSENHLEDYQKSNLDFQTLVFCEDVLSPDFARTILSSIDQNVEGYDYQQVRPVPISSISFRGPPELT